MTFATVDPARTPKEAALPRFTGNAFASFCVPATTPIVRTVTRVTRSQGRPSLRRGVFLRIEAVGGTGD
ncbi:hypothetical protein GCM10017600_77130 [Streptosporangium carneum]|uniref:Uncharacterized protein n=1 Tax=Streptosporangium carneum TaxID=47481 RepID=A0A9W6IA87_9ACTN|nr:hypothetical protein GCM10017600_77130 [Streptosporangium carneum]